TEGIAEFLNSSADSALQDIGKACIAGRQLFVAEGETTSVTGSWPLLQVAKQSRAGIALQPDQNDGPSVYRTPFPRVNRGDFLQGRGLLVVAGKCNIVQVALPE
ncbi:MAG: hypothetical protein HKL80_02020, partial [Acidimicrobiales bacterium]|nr:hypothetical protein [Acidimicrobiales bacterium]